MNPIIRETHKQFVHTMHPSPMKEGLTATTAQCDTHTPIHGPRQVPEDADASPKATNTSDLLADVLAHLDDAIGIYEREEAGSVPFSLLDGHRSCSFELPLCA